MQFFITRPVFAMVLSVLITLGGVLALTQLPIAQYPEVVPPQVVVTAFYPGPTRAPCPKPSPRRSSSR